MKIPVERIRNEPSVNRKLLKDIRRSESFSSFTTNSMASNEMASKGMRSLKNGQPHPTNNETRSGGMKNVIESNRSNRGGEQMCNKTGVVKRNPPNGKETVRGKTFSRPPNQQSEMENARKNNFSNMTPKSGKASNVEPKNKSESFAKKENVGPSVSNVPRFNPFRRGIEQPSISNTSNRKDVSQNSVTVNNVSENSKETRFNPFRRGIQRINNDSRNTDVMKNDYPNRRCQQQGQSNTPIRKGVLQNSAIVNSASLKENHFSNPMPAYGTSNRQPLHDMNSMSINHRFQEMQKLNTNVLADHNGSTLLKSSRRSEPIAKPSNFEEYVDIKPMPEFWWMDSKDDEIELEIPTSNPLLGLEENQHLQPVNDITAKNGEALGKPTFRGPTRSKTCPSFSIDGEVPKAVTMFIYGKDIVKPMVSWTDTAPFDAKMKRHLGIGPIITQTFSFAWPHLMEQKSLILIDISNGANAYLPTVCSIIQVSHMDFEKYTFIWIEP